MNTDEKATRRLRRKVIDIDTNEVYKSVREAAQKLGCTSPNICKNILCQWKVKGHRLEYLDYWEDLNNMDENSNNFKCML